MRPPIAVRCHAPNDRNGNPRRLALVLNPEYGTPIDAVPLGYTDMPAVRAAYPGIVEGMGINISPSEYKRLIRAYDRGNGKG